MHSSTAVSSLPGIAVLVQKKKAPMIDLQEKSLLGKLELFTPPVEA